MSLAMAYEIAHHYEITRKAARDETQLMRLGLRAMAEWWTRSAMVREDASLAPCEATYNLLTISGKGKGVRLNSGEVVCNGVGHMQRACPSPTSAPCSKHWCVHIAWLSYSCTSYQRLRRGDECLDSYSRGRNMCTCRLHCSEEYAFHLYATKLILN